MSGILDALRAKHSKDVFVAECNMGSAHGGARRLDAWVLLKTWSPWTTIGYEIKVDRQDFLRDRKWAEYLPVCHELYFVSPPKLIAPEELPQDVGLLWTTGGQRLQTKRKAVRREPDTKALSLLMSYALMSRARIVANMWEANGSKPDAEYWREWLAKKDADTLLGVEVSQRIRQIVRKAESRAQNAERERDALAEIRDRLTELGLDGCRSPYDLDRRLRQLGGDNGQLARDVRGLAQRILSLTEARQ